MTKGTLDYFSVLVIGDNPDEQIRKFDSMEDVSRPYILYNYTDIHKLRRNKIEIYKGLANKLKDSPEKNAIITKINQLKHISDEQYYAELGELNSYDVNKNIISTENPDGKWLTSEKGGRIFSKYMIGYDGKGIISGMKKDINWPAFHMNEERVNIYDRTWELCVNNIKPQTEKDASIIRNMKPYKALFKNFKNKVDYVKTSCSFWSYAIIFNGYWYDMEQVDSNSWIINFYDTFIKKLLDNELITIYECTK